MVVYNSKMQNRSIIVKKVFTPRDLLKFLLLIFLVFFLVFYMRQLTAPKEVSVTEAVELIQNNNVKQIDIRESEVVLVKKNGSKVKTTIESNSSFTQILQDEGITLSKLAESGVDVNIHPLKIGWLDVVNTLLNVAFLGIIAYSVVGFMGFLKRQSKGGIGGLISFGKSPAKLIIGKKPDTTFEDVAGLYEIKEEIKTVVDFLKNPDKYRKMGARIPKGILLEGPPGTGKTLIARAVAGEAGVPFFYTSGGEFEEMLVGAGAARVRDLFKKARALQPCIIFIDEIDAVAKKRGVDFRTTYSEQTLNQILAEMDGLEKNEAVIVMAATNRADVLDPAIMRPGRFDWRIRFNLPDYQERLEILRLHAKNKKLAKDVDLDTIAKITVGFSGAELESALNEAAILAVRARKPAIEQNDILEGLYKVSYGPQRKTMVMTKEDLLATAYHEAGHAIVSTYCEYAPVVRNITIIPRAKALGLTASSYDYEKMNATLAELLDRIAATTAGRAAEEIIYGKMHVSTGAANDIEQASDIARAIIKRFGMSQKLGFVSYTTREEYLLLGLKKDYSDKTAEEIDKEVRNIVMSQYERAKKILTREKRLLEEVAKALLRHETLDREQFLALVNKYGKKKPPKKKSKKVLPVKEWIRKISKEQDGE